MRIPTVFLGLLLLTSLLGASTIFASEPTRYNPFQRLISNPTTQAANTTTKSFRYNHPRLRGVLQAEDGSLANLDGHILAQGESALGYTLVAVQNHSAKFRFRQQLITLQVNEDRP